MPARKVPRSIHEMARDVARDIAKTDTYVRFRRERKKIEMLFAHLKRILRLDRLRLKRPVGRSRRVPPCRNGPEPPEARKADPDPCAPARLGAIKHPRAGRIIRSQTASSRTSSTQSTQSGLNFQLPSANASIILFTHSLTDSLLVSNITRCPVQSS
jgi:hypothetical protein